MRIVKKIHQTEKPLIMHRKVRRGKKKKLKIFRASIDLRSAMGERGSIIGKTLMGSNFLSLKSLTKVPMTISVNIVS
jgi:hypothetical protein